MGLELIYFPMEMCMWAVMKMESLMAKVNTNGQMVHCTLEVLKMV